MKIKSIFLVIFLLVGAMLNAQKVEIRPAFGIIWNDFNKTSPMRENMNYLAGFGINNYGHTFYAETGAYWNSINIGDYSTDSIPIVQKNQLRIPLKLGINFVNKNKKSFNFRMFAGPVGSVVIEDNIFDWSINAGFGVDIYPCFLNVGYDFDVTDYENVKVNYFYVKTGFIIMTRKKYYR